MLSRISANVGYHRSLPLKAAPMRDQSECMCELAKQAQRPLELSVKRLAGLRAWEPKLDGLHLRARIAAEVGAALAAH